MEDGAPDQDKCGSAALRPVFLRAALEGEDEKTLALGGASRKNKCLTASSMSSSQQEGEFNPPIFKHLGAKDRSHLTVAHNARKEEQAANMTSEQT